MLTIFNLKFSYYSNFKNLIKFDLEVFYYLRTPFLKRKKNMKIAIPTSDRITLFKRTGRTNEFAICEIIDGSYEFVEFRANPHQHMDENEEHLDHNHKDILESLRDCDALLVWTVGKNFKRDFDEAKFPIYKTTQEDLKEAISEFASNMLGHVRI